VSDRELVNDGIPLRTKLWADPHAYDGIDEGIRFAVRVLHSRGIETCQSCQGGAGHAYPAPTVDMLAGSNDAAGFMALAYLHAFGLPVVSVSKCWSVSNGEPFEMLWRIEFAHPFPERADEELMFLWGYQAQRTTKTKRLVDLVAGERYRVGPNGRWRELTERDAWHRDARREEYAREVGNTRVEVES
jgi:hypothetical protein